MFGMKLFGMQLFGMQLSAKNPTWSDVHDGKLVVVGVDVAAVVVVDDVAHLPAAPGII